MNDKELKDVQVTDIEQNSEVKTQNLQENKKPNTPQKVLKFIGIFFLYLLFSTIIVLALTLFGIDYLSLSTKQTLLLSIASDLGLSIILFLIYRKYLIEKWRDFRENCKKYLPVGLKAWGIGLILMYASNLLLFIFSPVKTAANESAVQEIIEASPFLALIFTTLFAPFIEEIIFRKSIKDMFSQKWPFIITSGLIFGLLHVINATSVYDLLYIIPYASLGGAFAYALYETDNLYTTIMLHMIHNGILTIISILI